MKARPTDPPPESKSYAKSPMCSSMSTCPPRAAPGMPESTSRDTYGMTVLDDAGLLWPRSPAGRAEARTWEGPAATVTTQSVTAEARATHRR